MQCFLQSAPCASASEKYSYPKQDCGNPTREGRKHDDRGAVRGCIWCGLITIQRVEIIRAPMHAARQAVRAVAVDLDFALHICISF
jgi:hypothetical protein